MSPAISTHRPNKEKRRQKSRIPTRKIDLSEKELKNLYHLSTLKKLRPGDVLVKENEKNSHIFLLLEGGIKFVKHFLDKEKVIVEHHIGSRNDNVTFFRKDPWPVSIIALDASIVLVIEQSALNSLDSNIQLYFYKRQHSFDVDLIDWLTQKERELRIQAEQYRAYLYLFNTSADRNYEKSELIQGVIKKIPRLPVHTSSLVGHLFDDRISSKDVTDMVQKDPSLAANILKTINSSYYGFDKKISDINHAIVLLGFNQLHHLIVEDGVRRVMPDSSNLTEILSHSICISRLAFALSLASQIGKPTEISTIGLLHDLGESLKFLIKKRNPKIEILADYLESAHMSALLLKQWHLPERVWKTIRYQNYPNFASPAEVPESLQTNISLLHLAHVCYSFLKGQVEATTIAPFLDDYIKFLKLGDLSLQQVVQKIVLPILTKNLESSPSVLRELINNHSRSISTQ